MVLVTVLTLDIVSISNMPRSSTPDSSTERTQQPYMLRYSGVGWDEYPGDLMNIIDATQQ